MENYKNKPISEVFPNVSKFEDLNEDQLKIWDEYVRQNSYELPDLSKLKEEAEEWKDSDDILYPIFFEGREWNKSDCDETFQDYYMNLESLNTEIMGVYISDNVWILPNGKLVFN